MLTCACSTDENLNIVEACGAHLEWAHRVLEQVLIERDTKLIALMEELERAIRKVRGK